MGKTRVIEVKSHVVFSAQSAEARFPRTKIVVAQNDPQIFSPPKAEFLEGLFRRPSILRLIWLLRISLSR
jgi:hypothetical protein